MAKPLIIERNPEVDDNIVVLDRHDSIAGYMATYGDQIAEWYEDNKLIIMPLWPLKADLDYLQDLTLPPSLAKTGSASGIDRPLYERQGQGLVSLNPITTLNANVAVQVYLRDQIAAIYGQLRKDLPQLFPRYKMREANITFRFTPTASEGNLHLDVFQATTDFHRIKLFINMDADYRFWNTSYDVYRVMEIYKDKFQDVACDIDRNTLNKLINDRIGMIAPRHAVHYPQLACVIGNGETVLHEVVSGNRMIGMEFMCGVENMLRPDKFIGKVLPQHMRDLGYAPTARQTA